VTEWIRANVMSGVTVHGFTVQGSKVDFSENLLVKVAHLIKFKGGPACQSKVRRAGRYVGHVVNIQSYSS